jgi:HemK-related putative methylase
MAPVGLRMLVRGPAKFLVARITRSRQLASLLFGIRFTPLPDRSLYYFDITTLALINDASRHVTHNTRVLDLGTGAAGIIGLTLWRRRGCTVTAADVHPVIADRARDNIAFNAAPIDVVQSSFFDNVAGELDVVIFNPPYVTSGHGTARVLNDAYRAQWDGGSEGTSVIRRFLDAVVAYRGRPLVLMGVNRWHATPDRLDALFKAEPRIELLEVVRHRFVPVNVYVFRRTG